LFPKMSIQRLNSCGGTMQTNIKRKLKQQAKKQALSKGLKIVATLAITYGPGGILGKILKIVGSKWVIGYLTKRIVK
ncbi:hypothetical protein J0689_27840, partial [Vibrio parahaemolyticus]